MACIHKTTYEFLAIIISALVLILRGIMAFQVTFLKLMHPNLKNYCKINMGNFEKTTSGPNVINLFLFVIYEFL